MELNQAMLIKIGITMMMILLMVTFAIPLNQMSEKNDFQQMANNEIERFGGLTPDALAEITNYSNEHYNGRFKITTPASSKLNPFEKVNYTYSMSISPPFFSTTILTFDFPGQAVSLVK